MMRTLAFLAVTLIGAVVMMYIAGRSLPANHVASRGERFDASREAVWKVLADVADYASWRRSVQRVELLSSIAGRLAWREHGGRHSVDYVADEMRPPERMVIRIASTDLPFSGLWRIDLAPEAGGTRVTIEEEGTVRNPLFRFVMKYVVGETTSIERMLADLGQRLTRERTRRTFLRRPMT